MAALCGWLVVPVAACMVAMLFVLLLCVWVLCENWIVDASILFFYFFCSF